MFDSPKFEDPDEGNRKVTISLQEIAVKYLVELQKTFDIFSFGIAGSSSLRENDYTAVTLSQHFMPSQTEHLGYEDAKKEHSVWLTKHLLAGVVQLAGFFIEDCRTICAICRLKKKDQTSSEAYHQVLDTERRSFMLLEIQEKFIYLRNEYGLRSDMENHIISLFKLFGVMKKKEGKVAEQDMNNPDGLNVKFKIVHLTPRDGTNADEDDTTDDKSAIPEPDDPISIKTLDVSATVEDRNIAFEVGETITLTRQETFGIILTVSVFIRSFLMCVEKFARASDQESE